MYNSEDICLWPNGDWCFLHELEEYQYNKSDDFEIITNNVGLNCPITCKEGCTCEITLS